MTRGGGPAVGVADGVGVVSVCLLVWVLRVGE